MTAALTAEEWAGVIEGAVGVVGAPDGGARHQVAAVCLYGQPFGFTREDVELMREASGNVWAVHSEMCVGDGESCGCRRESEKCDDLASRIEALLPPEPR